MKPFDQIWNAIRKYEDSDFHQLRGKAFTYKFIHNAVKPSTTNITIPRSHFEKAWGRMPVTGPGGLQDLRGPSYLFAILSDSRILAPYTDRGEGSSMQYKEGYAKGRIDEAETTLRNLYIILDEMKEPPHQTNHILTCIHDLEKLTGKDRDFFDSKENAFRVIQRHQGV